MISKKKKKNQYENILIFILILHDHIPYLWLFNRRTGTALVNMDFQCQAQSTKNHSRDGGLRETQTFMCEGQFLGIHLSCMEISWIWYGKAMKKPSMAHFPKGREVPEHIQHYSLKEFTHINTSAALPRRSDAKLSSTDLSKPRRFWDGVYNIHPYCMLKVKFNDCRAYIEKKNTNPKPLLIFTCSIILVKLWFLIVISLIFRGYRETRHTKSIIISRVWETRWPLLAPSFQMPH